MPLTAKVEAMEQEKKSEETEIRLEKIHRLRESGRIPYASRFQTTHRLDQFGKIEDGTSNIGLAGRIISIRSFGKLVFCHIQDSDGKCQIALKKDELSDMFDDFVQFVDVGDYLGALGTVFTTRTGERTLRVSQWELLSKALRPLPDKFHGVVDTELLRRKRYLDLISNPHAVERFKLRSRFIHLIREYLVNNDFMEIDTPVLTNKVSGAIATPFTAHYGAFSQDVYLRIAPEIYLKRAVAAGFKRVFEVARCFRNEGIDVSHLPDFTMIEFYASYWDYRDNMDFTEKMIKYLVKELTGKTELDCAGKCIDFSGDWPKIPFNDLILRDCGIDISAVNGREELVREIKARGIDPGVDMEKAGFITILDLLYKKVSRPKLIQPVFVIEHPVVMSPLARRNDMNPGLSDRFQLVLNGWEIVNAYSELVDPIDQRKRLEEQAIARHSGDEQAMDLDEDFLACMEHGMPPMSGWGMGVDRFVSILTDCENLRDVVLFPLLRSDVRK